METGLIPPNLHFQRAKDSIAVIVEGRMNVITTPTPWEGGLAGVNSFGFGGANAHILLKSNPKEKRSVEMMKDGLPRVVGVSARTEQGLNGILDDVSSHCVRDVAKDAHF